MIPHLTVGERADLHGVSYLEERELEQAQPWVRHWAARFGAGAERMRTWFAAGRPVADRSALCVIGDPSIVAAVRAVVAKLPEAVAAYLVRSVTFVGVGRSTRGWCGDVPTVPDPQRMIALATDDEGVIAHEVAHSWQTAPSLVFAGLTVEQGERVRAAAWSIAIEKGDAELALEQEAQRERAADALACAWGFQVDSSGGRRRGLYESNPNPNPAPTPTPTSPRPPKRPPMPNSAPMPMRREPSTLGGLARGATRSKTNPRSDA